MSFNKAGWSADVPSCNDRSALTESLNIANRSIPRSSAILIDSFMAVSSAEQIEVLSDNRKLPSVPSSITRPAPTLSSHILAPSVVALLNVMMASIDMINCQYSDGFWRHLRLDRVQQLEAYCWRNSMPWRILIDLMLWDLPCDRVQEDTCVLVE